MAYTVTDTFSLTIKAKTAGTTEDPEVRCSLTVRPEFKSQATAWGAPYNAIADYTLGFPRATAPFELTWSTSTPQSQTSTGVSGSSAPSATLNPIAPNLSRVENGKTVRVGPSYAQELTVTGSLPGKPNTETWPATTYTGELLMHCRD